MSKAPLLLRSALASQSSLQVGIKLGLGAVKRSDRRLLAEPVKRAVGDSIDLDDATRLERPQANRWDYLFSFPSSCKIVGVEPHSADDGEIPVVIAKKKEAQTYLQAHFRAGYSVSDWFWITRGSVGFLRTEAARRRLDQNGITFKRRLDSVP